VELPHGSDAPPCPVCGSQMVRRVASRGTRAGQPFWGCPRFPECRGIVNIDAPAADEPGALTAGVAGGSAQAEYERRVERENARFRRLWPMLVGLGVVIIVGAFVASFAVISSVLGFRAGLSWGAVSALLALLLCLGAVLRTPQTTLAWRRGAEGERKTARYLEGLGEAGFVSLHDRRVAGLGGNLDHVAIGPTGVWVVETKALRGKVVIDGDSLRIGGRRQDRIIGQASREAATLQVALRDLLDPLHLTVRPVICLHEGELPWFNKTVRGVRLASGRELVRLMQEGETVLDLEAVQRLAREADRRLAR
jgi:ssDNA-binding Zn-finger/Zn-ribbon topoisomerase 1